MRFGTSLASKAPVLVNSGPKMRTGKRANVSALRPTTNKPKVNTALKNGEENAENSVAIAVTSATSESVSRAEPSTTRRSSGAPPAKYAPASKIKNAHGMGKYVRNRTERKASTPATSVARSATDNGTATGRPASTPNASSSTPELAAMNTARVSTVPKYLPTKYSERRIGRAKIGKMVFSSSSR